MNKKSNIKLAGTIFHLDQTEINGIEKYFRKVKSYFFNSEDLEEIVADRENLISKILRREGNKGVTETTNLNEDGKLREKDLN